MSRLSYLIYAAGKNLYGLLTKDIPFVVAIRNMEQFEEVFNT